MEVDEQHDQYMRTLRFKWWKETFLSAVAGLSASENARFPSEIANVAATIANHGGARVSQAYEHFVVKGLIAPEPKYQ